MYPDHFERWCQWWWVHQYTAVMCTSAPVQWCAPVSAPDFTTRQPALAVKAGPIKNAHNFAAKETSFKMQTDKITAYFGGLG